ncbi:MAG TPA: hypothetical protein VD999_04715 [Vitreimonas sp.]|nr:hypothetical protein [Vitreimonas sp.]
MWYKLRWFLLVAWLALVVIASRRVFVQPFEYSYLSDLYDQSQWRIPLSTRIISDNELYQVAGYRLVNQQDYFTTNPEVPPFGKWAYGLAATWLGNPYWASLMMFMIALGCYYCLCRALLHTDQQVWLAVGLLAITPLFFSQLSQTMMDLPLLLALLIHSTCLTLLLNVKTRTLQTGWLVIGAGVGLGLFTATKAPLYVPVLVLAAGWMLGRKRWLEWFSILAIAGLTYLALYWSYFLSGHTLLEWIGTQKWMINFYAQSGIKTVPLMVWFSTLTGHYVGWWNTSNWESIQEWSILWPLSLVAMLVWVHRRVVSRPKTLSPSLDYVALITLGILGLQSLTPFWARYFLVILPLMIIFLVPHLQGKKPLHQLIIGLIIVQAFWFLPARPQTNLPFAIQNWNRGHYQDVYSFLSLPAESPPTRRDFFLTLKKFEGELQVSTRSAELNLPRVWPWQNQVATNITTRFQTPIGEITTYSPVILTRRNNYWYWQWDWEMVVPHFTAQSKVELREAYAPSGVLSTSDKLTLSAVNDHPFILVTPQLMTNTPEFLKLLGELTGQSEVNLEERLLVSSIGSEPIPIGFVVQKYNQSKLDQLKGFASVKIITRPHRIFSPEVLKANQEAYITRLISEHPELSAKPGGKIVHLPQPQLEPNNEVVIFEKNPEAGVDVIIPQTAAEIIGQPTN